MAVSVLSEDGRAHLVHAMLYLGTEHYTWVAGLGRGAFGVVLQAQCKATRATCAVKLVAPAASGHAAPHAVRELHAVSHLATSRNVVRFSRALLLSNGVVALVMPCYSASLRVLISLPPPPPLALVQCVVRSVVLALRDAHARGFVSQDLKPDNILLRPLDHAHAFVVLADWGMVVDVRVAAQPPIVRAGTLWYAAPEALWSADGGGGAGGGAHVPADAIAARDVWALGVVAHELLLGLPSPIHMSIVPAGASLHAAVLRTIVRLYGVPPVGTPARVFLAACGLSDSVPAAGATLHLLHTARRRRASACHDNATTLHDAHAFATACLQYEPLARMTPAAALQHAFVRGAPRVADVEAVFPASLRRVHTRRDIAIPTNAPMAVQRMARALATLADFAPGSVVGVDADDGPRVWRHAASAASRTALAALWHDTVAPLRHGAAAWLGALHIHNTLGEPLVTVMDLAPCWGALVLSSCLISTAMHDAVVAAADRAAVPCAVAAAQLLQRCAGALPRLPPWAVAAVSTLPAAELAALCVATCGAETVAGAVSP
jgi:serine/threonine protein kinase